MLSSQKKLVELFLFVQIFLGGCLAQKDFYPSSGIRIFFKDGDTIHEDMDCFKFLFCFPIHSVHELEVSNYDGQIMPNWGNFPFFVNASFDVFFSIIFSFEKIVEKVKEKEIFEEILNYEQYQHDETSIEDKSPQAKIQSIYYREVLGVMLKEENFVHIYTVVKMLYHFHLNYYMISSFGNEITRSYSQVNIKDFSLKDSIHLWLKFVRWIIPVIYEDYFIFDGKDLIEFKKYTVKGGHGVCKNAFLKRPLLVDEKIIGNPLLKRVKEFKNSSVLIY